jgi:hypothetical protein
MRHMQHPTAGRPADIVLDSIVRLRLCRDLADVERAMPTLIRVLEYTARRVAGIARKGGSSPGVHGPLRWLDAVCRELPALDEPGGESLRSELRSLIARIRERA